jgi:hypothetical protein
MSYLSDCGFQVPSRSISVADVSRLRRSIAVLNIKPHPHGWG